MTNYAQKLQSEVGGVHTVYRGRSQSCPRVGCTRGSGRVGSRFCRILAGRVGPGQVSTSDFLVVY